MGLVAHYNLRSMFVRKGTAEMTALGIAMVVATFVITLALAQRFRATLVASGSPQNAIVLRRGATSETVSAVARTDVPLAGRGVGAGRRRTRMPAGVARHGISTGTTNWTSFSEVAFKFRITRRS